MKHELSNHLKISYLRAAINLIPYQGLKPKALCFVSLISFLAAINLIPYQGLKLSPLLTSLKRLSNLAAINLIPYQGLKPDRIEIVPFIFPCAAINLIPYQGLKQNIELTAKASDNEPQLT